MFLEVSDFRTQMGRLFSHESFLCLNYEMLQGGWRRRWGIGACGIMTESGHVPAKTVSLFIISDEGIPREALVHFFNARPEFHVIGSANVAEAQSASWEPRPSVVLIHSGVVSAQTLALITSLSARRIPAVVLLRQRNPWLVRAFHRAGATGLVSVEAMPSDLICSVNAAATHKRSVGPLLAVALFDSVSRLTDISMPDLSARESQVLKYIAYGYSNVQVAKHLKVSTKSVETYRSRLMEKLDLKGRTDIVRFALLTGILNPDDVESLAS